MATKSAKSNTWAAFDSDEEDGHCCSSRAAVRQKTAFSLDLSDIEQKIVRRRFWPYPSEEEQSTYSGWPCISCCPWMCDEGDFWECEHGKWVFVDSWDSVPVLPEDHSLEECRGGGCSGHGLMSGDILAMHLAMQAGIMWGDLVIMEEEHNLSQETPAERAAREAEAARRDAEARAALARFEIQKAKELVATRSAPPQRRYDRRTGKPMPCKFFCYQGVLGKEHPAERDPKSGTMWESGCAYHKKGKCEFFHPDEPEWQVILGKVASVTPSRPQTPTEPEWRTVGGGNSSRSTPFSGGGSGRSSPYSGGGGNSSRPSSGRANGGAGGRW